MAEPGGQTPSICRRLSLDKVQCQLVGTRHVRRQTPDCRTRRAEGGFTLIELLIASTVLIVGLTGIVALQVTGIRSSAFSRHATEAAVLAESRIEQLRTIPLAAGTTVESGLNPQGRPVTGGLYTRTTVITTNATFADIVVTVTWNERGSEPHQVVLQTRRTL